MNFFNASIRLSTGSVSVSSTSSSSSSGFAVTVAGLAVLRVGFGDRVGPATGVEVFVSSGVVSNRGWVAGEGLAIAAGASEGCEVGVAEAGFSVGNGDAFGVGVAIDGVSDGCAAGGGVSTAGAAGEALGVGCATGDSFDAGVCIAVAKGCGDGVSLGDGDGVSFDGAELLTTLGRVCATRFSAGFWSSDSKVKLFRSP